MTKQISQTISSLRPSHRKLFGQSVAATAVALFLFAKSSQGATPKVGVKAGVLDGLMNAGPVVQLLVFIMLALSVLSWAIIFTKYRQFKAVREANADFSEKFWRTTSLESLFHRISEYNESNLARVFKAAFLELQRLADTAIEEEKGEDGESPATEATEGSLGKRSTSAPVRLFGIDNMERAVRNAIDTEVSLIEARLGFLATTGSTAPFIGLLGTVIGIMTSFSQIAASGSASLAVVAPGISEALFSTAVGLFAALPAVAAYNYFIGQVRRIEMDLNSFGSDFLNIAKRNFFRE
jgi:biopolymer transport protein TolQ